MKIQKRKIRHFFTDLTTCSCPVLFFLPELSGIPPPEITQAVEITIVYENRAYRISESTDKSLLAAARKCFPSHTKVSSSVVFIFHDRVLDCELTLKELGLRSGDAILAVACSSSEGRPTRKKTQFQFDDVQSAGAAADSFKPFWGGDVLLSKRSGRRVLFPSRYNCVP